MAPFDGKYLTSYLMARVMFAPSLNENEDQGKGVEEQDLSHSTEDFRFHIGDFSEF